MRRHEAKHERTGLQVIIARQRTKVGAVQDQPIFLPDLGLGLGLGDGDGDESDDGEAAGNGITIVSTTSLSNESND